MNKKQLLKLTTSVALGVGLAACASVPPTELVDARQAYRASEKGPAAEHAQSYLQVAKVALTKAEGAFKEDGNKPRTRDLAYIAQRQAQIADVQAGVAMAKRDKTEAERNLGVANKQIQNQTQDELAQAKAQLADSTAKRSMEQQAREVDQEKLRLNEKALVKNEKALEKSTAQLDLEKKARLDAEKRSTEARAELSRIAQVRDEERGMVINLAGNVLFASGKSQLLTGGHAQLTQVSTALKGMPEKRILIEGHTDSMGSDDTNQRLSQLRAEAVRDFLVNSGIERDRIEAVGIGETRPSADNGTSEGRANNRRVEIVLRAATS